jgi:maltodextrin utilization protein YvdJ
MTTAKPGYPTLAAVATAAGVATMALAFAWWKFLLLLALLAACAAVPVAHTVLGTPKDGA